MLHIENVSKIYTRTQKQALDQVSLEIAEGEFTALLGQNGAGKSTLINVLAGNVKKTNGTVSIAGHDLDREELEIKRVLGVVPQEIAYDFSFTVEEILKMQSGYFGIHNNDQYIDELLAELALSDKKKSRSRELSGGMKRRLLIARALVHKPKILILDEPTAGVDIELRHTMYDFLEKLHRTGTTIILTTHYLEEAERLCERIVVINKGRIVADKPKRELMGEFSREVTMEIEFANDVGETVHAEFLHGYHPELTSKKTLRLTLHKEEVTKVLGMLAERQIQITDVNIERKKLEDIYLQLIRQ